MTTQTTSITLHQTTSDWDGVSDPTAVCGQWLDIQYDMSWLNDCDADGYDQNGEHISEHVSYLYGNRWAVENYAGHILECVQPCEECFG